MNQVTVDQINANLSGGNSATLIGNQIVISHSSGMKRGRWSQICHDFEGTGHKQTFYVFYFNRQPWSDIIVRDLDSVVSSSADMFDEG